jgi:hypothetical protein
VKKPAFEHTPITIALSVIFFLIGMFFVHRRFYGMMIKSDQTYTLLCSPTNKNPERFRFGVVLSEFSTSRYRRRRPASNPETTASIAAEGAGMVFVSSTVPIELMKWC